jgi:hypothetical protein
MKNKILYVAAIMLLIGCAFPNEDAQSYSGTYQIIAKIGNNLALDVQGVEDGSRVVINNGDRNALSQQWRIERQSGGTYTIKNVKSNKLMEVKGASMENADVIQYSNNGGANQRWYITVAMDTNYVKITNVNSGKVLDVWHEQTQVFTPLIQYTDNNTYNQQFKLIKIK